MRVWWYVFGNDDMCMYIMCCMCVLLVVFMCVYGCISLCTYYACGYVCMVVWRCIRNHRRPIYVCMRVCGIVLLLFVRLCLCVYDVAYYNVRYIYICQ